jgi:hypothetical protein
MMIRDNGDIESESDRYDCEGMPPLEDSDGDELALLVEESLVIRRTLQVQVKVCRRTIISIDKESIE